MFCTAGKQQHVCKKDSPSVTAHLLNINDDILLYLLLVCEVVALTDKIHEWK